MKTKPRIVAWMAMLLLGACFAFFSFYFFLKIFLIGVPPRVAILEMIYRDVPPVTVPLDLQGARQTELHVRVIEKYGYVLYFGLHHDPGNAGQSARAQEIMGEYPAGSVTKMGKPTAFHVVIVRSDGRVVRDAVTTSEGLNAFTGSALYRQIDAFDLDPDQYSVKVEAVGDYSDFAPFRASVRFTHRRGDWPQDTAK